MMVGNTISARVSEPERTDRPILSAIAKKTKPKSPKMIEGTPARQSAPNRITVVSRPSRVYSVRYTAVATPIGAASRTASPATRNVPRIIGKMPPSRPMLRGDCVRKLQVTWGKPCTRMKARMKTSTASVIAVRIHMKPTAMRWVVAGEILILRASCPRAGERRRVRPR